MPAPVLIPVLPPTAASTIPSNVVGTWTTRTPRSQVAATNPPTSVVAPPPKVTTTSERVKPASPSSSQQRSATAYDLEASPGRHEWDLGDLVAAVAQSLSNPP